MHGASDFRRLRGTFAFVACALTCACGKSGKTGRPAGPPALASCNYVSKTFQTNHSCTEIYEASQVDAAEKFCTSLKGARDNGTFTRGAGCPTEGRHGGCMNADGSVAWIYEGEHSCMFGVTFDDEPPAHGPIEPYRCTTAKLCQEQLAVVDLSKTVAAKNCSTGGGEFARGACPTANAIGSCITGPAVVTKQVFYAPLTAEQAQPLCDGAPFVPAK